MAYYAQAWINAYAGNLVSIQQELHDADVPLLSSLMMAQCELLCAHCHIGHVNFTKL